MNKSKVMIVLLVIIIAVVSILLSKKDKIETNDNGGVIENQNTKIVLYFANPKTGELIREYRNVDVENIKNDMPTTIINELIKGPQNPELSTTISNATKVNSISIEKNKIIIDFSKEFKENTEDELKRLHKIYSVVNSLTEITEINEVEIRVEGEFITSKVRL